MKKSKVSLSVLDKIKTEKIEPRPKFYFVAKYSLFLVAGILFFIIGVIATAIIWHFFHDTQLLAIFEQERGLFFRGFLLSFPILWFVIAVLLVVLVEYFAKNTKNGYKISPRWWFVGIVVGQVFCGLLLEQSPIGRHLEHGMTQELHIMHDREGKFRELWQNPQKGLLTGEVTQIEDFRKLGRNNKKKSFQLEDLDGKIWTILIESRVPGFRGLELNDKIRIIGKPTMDNNFKAKKIFNRKFKERNERRERRSIMNHKEKNS